jgi:hypothetical protein
MLHEPPVGQIVEIEKGVALAAPFHCASMPANPVETGYNGNDR